MVIMVLSPAFHMLIESKPTYETLPRPGGVPMNSNFWLESKLNKGNGFKLLTFPKDMVPQT